MRNMLFKCVRSVSKDFKQNNGEYPNNKGLDTLAVLKVWLTSLKALLHIDLANCAFFRSLWTILWYRLFRVARFSPTFSCLLFSESIILAKLQDKRRKIERVPKASATTCILWERWLHFCHCAPSPFPLSFTPVLTFQVFKPSLPSFFHLCTSFVSLDRFYIIHRNLGQLS